MQTDATLARVIGVITSMPVGDAKGLMSALRNSGVSLSVQYAGRLLRGALCPAELRSFDLVFDGNGRRLNPVVASSYDAFSRRRRIRVYFGQLVTVAGKPVLVLSDRRGSLLWAGLDGPIPEAIAVCLKRVKDFLGRDYSLVPHGFLHAAVSGLEPPRGVTVVTYAHSALPYQASSRPSSKAKEQTHLDELEAESVRIIRETVAVAKKPGMLFSMGKDSMVMWTLAKKAFFPDPPAFPLVVIDTRWKFQDMYQFRKYMSELPETELVVHINPDAIALDVNPFDFGSARHTDITKTLALKQVLDNFQFDFVFGGARRDEEKSRAKERVFSVRNEKHGWDPKTQRPELWNVYNTVLAPGHTMRVFPLSNWTELDVWRYIERETIPVVPLYFAQVRPFVERNGALIMADDERFRLEEGEDVRFESIRFRTLGCYPLTGGVKSNATTISDIISELEHSRVSERSSRVIDFDPGASMEQKKKDGYF